MMDSILQAKVSVALLNMLKITFTIYHFTDKGTIEWLSEESFTNSLPKLILYYKTHLFYEFIANETM